MNIYFLMKHSGYRPFHATKRLNNGIEDPESDPEESPNETLRSFVREHVRGVYFMGFRSSTLEDIRKLFPKLFSYLNKNYSDFIPGCKVVIKQTDKIQEPTPYVLLPNKKMTVISWDKAQSCPVYPQSEDLARYIEKLK